MNAHMEEIINLFPVKGSNYFRVQEFYEKLSKNYDALQTLEVTRVCYDYAYQATSGKARSGESG